MKLAELEQYFAAIATSTSGPPADVAEVFKDSARLPARELLGIYNRGYHYRLLGVLASVFPRTERALGAAEFEQIGLLYLAEYPSDHPAVERIGRFFARYLRTVSAASEEARDLAALEWARLCALIAPDSNAIATAAGIDTRTFPSSRLYFVPSLETQPVLVGALALFPGVSSEPTEASDSPAERRVVAVWRKRHVVLHEALAPLEAAALQLAREGASVSRVCALFTKGTEEENVARAFRVVAAWFAREWIERSEVVTE
jgi:hypothetical protein